MKKIKLEDIIVKDRFRKELGDINELAKSIKKRGLISPITVTDDNVLIDGERRLTALSMNKETHTDVHIMEIVEKNGVMHLEYDANEVRKSFTPSEKAQMLEVFKKENNVKAGRPKKQLVANATNKSENEKRNEVAQAVGFKNKDEGYRATKIQRDCVPEIIELVDDGTISISTGANHISKLPKEDQTDAAKAAKKHGGEKWYYYEYQQSVINNLEKKIIDRDQADGYAKAVKDGRRTTRQVTRELEVIKSSMMSANAKGEAKLKEEASIYESKWIKVDVSKDNLVESMQNVMYALDITDVKKIKNALDGITRKERRK